MFCSNINHNISWTTSGGVTPCNNLYNFPTSSVEEMKSTVEYQQLRTCNVNNTWSEYCVRCRDKELIGLTSKRQSDNRVHKVYNLISSDYVKIDGAIGTICNAGCRICGSHSSTFWQQEDKKFKTELDIIQINANGFWDQVWQDRDNILQLDLGGGEPWLNNIDQQQKIFNYWIQNNRAKLIKIRYNTNGSLYPKKLLEQLTKFREVCITLSIDDIEERFEYTRYPLKWATVLENVKQLSDLKNTHSNIILEINYTVSVFTFLYAQKFRDYADTVLNINKVNFNILEAPIHYSIKSLPSEIKQNVSKDNMFYDLISKTPMEQWELTFNKNTSIIDDRRKQSFATSFRELNYILRSNHGKAI